MVSLVVLKLATALEFAFASGAKADYVDIDGHTYYINTDTIYCFWKECRDMCESINRTLITFETERKWLAINDYLSQDEILKIRWFWTDAIKNEGSSTWFWATSGERITEFFWAADQPDEDPNAQASISFQNTLGGYDDAGINEWPHSLMCQ